MDKFWQQYYALSAKANPQSPLKQVGKTVNGLSVDSDQIDLIVTQVTKELVLTPTDQLGDLGCGNGLLTARFAPKAERIIALDFSRELLAYAASHSAKKNIEFGFADLTNLAAADLEHINKLLMYEVLQHLSVSELLSILKKLYRLKPGTLFFIGGIPDKEKLRTFYDTEEKFAFYEKCESLGTPHLGRWWQQCELEDTAKSVGWEYRYVPQPAKLYTSYYRFDAVLTKK